MASNDFYNGQDIWVTGGSNTGRRGTVVGSGLGSVRVQLDAETKVFSKADLSTTNPQTVPLPPNFLPLDHSVGATVKVEGHPLKSYNGVTGTVIKLPTSTSYGNGGDKRYHFTVTDSASTHHNPGTVLCFEPKFLKAAPAKRVEGEEIAHADVRVGDTIRVEYRSGVEGFRQLSSKEGKVTMIARTGLGDHPARLHTFRTSYAGSTHTLNYNHIDEKIILVKAAPNPHVEILSKLKAGTVVVLEKQTGEVLVFTKSTNWLDQSQWHKVSSASRSSSTFVTDGEIVDLLDRGAEIVHKVR